MEKARTDYRDIPIVDAARRCGVQIKDSTLGRREVEAVCPFCGDKLRRHHLSLNTKTDQYYCQLCGASGNSVSLYARLNNISFADAARELLDEGNNIYQIPRAPQRKNTPPEREPKPLAERHDIYYEMLSHLTLSEKHIGNLRDRGLSDERIFRNMYRTLPDSEAARRFLAGMLADFYDLNGVPGFYTDKQGRWSITGKGGLLIPVCDKSGYIQGLQVRLDDETLGDNGRRYRWLSSRYKENGTKSGTWIHITGNVSAKTAYLTEGPLKGDVASFHDNDALFICVAGINATDGLRQAAASLLARDFIVALDMDKITNRQVREACKKIAHELSGIKGARVRIANWDSRYKGIDDYYHAAGQGQPRPLVLEAA